MTKIVLATTNEGKVREIRAVLAPLRIELLSLNDFSIPPIEEPYSTFIENALAKARAVSQHTKLPALADDSGLCVNTLNFAPGVHSARFAGPEATDNDNNAKLLKTLQTCDQREAFYYCALVLIQSPQDPQPMIAEGRWYGEIAREPAGENGFGYDPLFYLPEYHLTAAQLPLEEKNRISHRGIALQQLMDSLEALSFVS